MRAQSPLQGSDATMRFSTVNGFTNEACFLAHLLLPDKSYEISCNWDLSG